MENDSPPSTSRRAAGGSFASSGIVRVSRAKSSGSTGGCRPASKSTSGHASQSRQRVGRSIYAGSSHSQTQQRNSASTLKANDPFVSRQQAEVAAVEAYLRAQQQQSPYEANVEEGRPKLQRRRSRISGRTEGGHFEDARLGRRKSGSRQTKSDGAGAAKVKSSPPRSKEVGNESATSGETVVTKKRAVVPPLPSSSSHVRGAMLEVPTATSAAAPSTERGRVRYSQAGYSDGSLMPRHGTGGKQRSSELYTSAPIQGGHSANDRSNAPSTHRTTDADMPVRQAPRRPGRSSHTDEGLVAQARDKCLQDFQQKKVKERKSMILAPFQKLRAANTFSGRSSGFDNSLPPFNYADEDVPLPTSSPPLPPPSQSELPVYTIPVHERKSRSFTESIKGRFMKAFRKPSRVPSGLPPQQVEGRTFQISTTTPSSIPDVVSAEAEDPFVVAGQYLAVPDGRTASAVSKRTTNTTAKSRVTSWTTSTVAGTWSTRSEAEKVLSADEHGRLKRSDSVSTLRTAKSFFGRPMQSKLRRPSRAQLQSSEESTGLYSALQEHIHPSDSASQVVKEDDTVNSRTSSALATLPSQQRPASTLASSVRRSEPTIRSVTPDPTVYKLDIPSPVEEILSPAAATTSFRSKPDDESTTPRSQLQRRPAMKAPTPSKEQLTRRMERSKNRWQSQLDDMSPTIVPRGNRLAMMDDNPYELRSLSRTLHQTPAASDALPHHARVVDEQTEQDDRAEAVLSPSLYSRGTDDASPRSDTPVDQGGMMITITGREVRSYSISPQKRETKVEKPAVASGEWRRWLSNEWKGWNAAEALTLPKTILQSNEPASSGAQVSTSSRAQERSRHQRLDSDTPPLKAPPLEMQQHKRPRSMSSRSSFMNERYPIVDSGRTSTDIRKISSRNDSRPNSAGPIESRITSSGLDTRMTTAMAGKDTNAGMPYENRPASVVHQPRLVSKHQSVVELGNAARTQAQGDAHTILKPKTEARPIDDAATTTAKATSKSRSAFDLRANYKNRHNGNIRTIPINRQKAETVQRQAASSPVYMLEDTTIQNISAGPYASQAHSSLLTQQNANKENETPPPLSSTLAEVEGLPSVSSSEWLAAGGMGKSRARKPSAVQAVSGTTGGSRYSPSRRVTGTTPPAGGSPGQRLVTSWLDGKKGNENSPAFI